MENWTGLVIGTRFWEMLEPFRDRVRKEGLRLIPDEWKGDLSAEKVRDWGEHAEAIFGFGQGLDAELFDAAKSLKVISLNTSGYECVDIDAATRAGVVVTNAATELLSESVADLTFGLILSIAREIPMRHQRLVVDRIKVRDLAGLVFGKTIGILGLGRIGKAAACRAVGFGMRILAYEPLWDEEHDEFIQKVPVERMDLVSLLRASDFVSLHLREVPETIGLIGEKELSQMKPNACLINTARARLVDDKALYRALESGRIAGAGLDTIADRGLDSPLLGLPNVVGTPHMGGATREAQHDVTETALECAFDVLQGRRPRYLVNPEVYDG